LAFLDDKDKGEKTGDGLDPVDKILQRINKIREEQPEESEIPAGGETLSDGIPVIGGNEAETDENKEGLCVRCGKQPKDLTVSPDYEYCAECRKDMLRVSAGPKGFAAAVLILLIAVAAVFVTLNTGRIAKQVYQAGKYESLNRYGDAVASYDKASEEAVNANNFFTVPEAKQGEKTGKIDRFKTTVNQKLTNMNFYTTGTRTYVDKMLASIQNDGFSAAGDSLVNAYDSAGMLRWPWLSKLQGFYEFYKSFGVDTRAVVSELFQPYQSAEPKDIPFDTLTKDLDALKTGKDAAKHKDYVVEYYKFVIASYSGKKDDELLKLLLNVKKMAPDKPWLYDYDIAYFSINLKKYDDAMKIFDEGIARNRNSLYSYYYKIVVLNKQEKYDAAFRVCEDYKKYNKDEDAYGFMKAEIYSSKALSLVDDKKFDEALKVSKDLTAAVPDSPKIFTLNAEIYRRKNDLKSAKKACDDGIKAGGSTELYRQQAILFLLEGKIKDAYEAGETAYQFAYNNGDVTPELFMTVALCASLANEKDTYDYSVTQLSQRGYELSDSVKKCIAGDIKPADIFINGEGDVL